MLFVFWLERDARERALRGAWIPRMGKEEDVEKVGTTG